MQGLPKFFKVLSNAKLWCAKIFLGLGAIILHGRTHIFLHYKKLKGYIKDDLEVCKLF